MDIAAMSGAFGATVTGIDLADPLGDGDVLTLIHALYDHRILVIPGQSLTKAQYNRFGSYWGDPISFYVPKARDDEYPNLIKITNSPETPPESRDGAMHWHADSSYEANPAFVTMLYAIEAPAQGNDTMFADCIAAYDALTDETKGQIADLEVIHDPRGGKVHIEGEVRGRGRTQELPIVTHPLVMRHPGTGRTTLYGFSGTAAGIVGMDEDEAIELLLRLKHHVLAPQFRQRATAGVGSVLIWDNHAVVHSATPTIYSDADGERRLLHRFSTRSLPALVRGTQRAGAT